MCTSRSIYFPNHLKQLVDTFPADQETTEGLTVVKDKYGVLKFQPTTNQSRCWCFTRSPKYSTVLKAIKLSEGWQDSRCYPLCGDERRGLELLVDYQERSIGPKQSGKIRTVVDRILQDDNSARQIQTLVDEEFVAIEALMRADGVKPWKELDDRCCRIQRLADESPYNIGYKNRRIDGELFEMFAIQASSRQHQAERCRKNMLVQFEEIERSIENGSPYDVIRLYERMKVLLALARDYGVDLSEEARAIRSKQDPQKWESYLLKELRWAERKARDPFYDCEQVYRSSLEGWVALAKEVGVDLSSRLEQIKAIRKNPQWQQRAVSELLASAKQKANDCSCSPAELEELIEWTESLATAGQIGVAEQISQIRAIRSEQWLEAALRALIEKIREEDCCDWKILKPPGKYSIHTKLIEQMRWIGEQLDRDVSAEIERCNAIRQTQEVRMAVIGDLLEGAQSIAHAAYSQEALSELMQGRHSYFVDCSPHQVDKLLDKAEAIASTLGTDISDRSEQIRALRTTPDGQQQLIDELLEQSMEIAQNGYIVEEFFFERLIEKAEELALKCGADLTDRIAAIRSVRDDQWRNEALVRWVALAAQMRANPLTLDGDVEDLLSHILATGAELGRDDVKEPCQKILDTPRAW